MRNLEPVRKPDLDQVDALLDAAAGKDPGLDLFISAIKVNGGTIAYTSTVEDAERDAERLAELGIPTCVIAVRGDRRPVPTRAVLGVAV